MVVSDNLSLTFTSRATRGPRVSGNENVIWMRLGDMQFGLDPTMATFCALAKVDHLFGRH